MPSLYYYCYLYIEALLNNQTAKSVGEHRSCRGLPWLVLFAEQNGESGWERCAGVERSARALLATGFGRKTAAGSALKEQACGQFRHNSAVIHRKSGRLRLIPFCGAHRTGVGAQACAWVKPLIREGKTGLSTERAGAYYYDYVFIKALKKKTGTT